MVAALFIANVARHEPGRKRLALASLSAFNENQTSGVSAGRSAAFPAEAGGAVVSFYERWAEPRYAVASWF